MITKSHFVKQYSGAYSKAILRQSSHTPFNLSIINLEPNTNTYRHNHHDEELWVILSGHGEISLDNNTFLISAGDVINVKPFKYHKVTNTDSIENLVFLACWWSNTEHFQNAITEYEKIHHELPKKTLIISSFPTPNGPLHLGHLAGPFIAEDIYARYLRQHDMLSYLVCGLDQNQSWCTIQKEKTQIFSQNITDALLKIGFQEDLFITPQNNQDYVALTQNILKKLIDNNQLIYKKTQIFKNKASNKYIPDCEIIGNCPSCFNIMKGNICEACLTYVEEVKIINPKSDNGDDLEIIEAELLYFPLSRYTTFLLDFIKTSTMNPYLKEICFRFLSNGLHDIPITTLYPSGIVAPANISKCGDQFLRYHFEQVTRLVYSLNYFKTNLNELTDYQIVRFFGIDNAFLYVLYAPALLFAYEPKLLQYSAFITNQYYLLNGKKFSTSRKHAVWAIEFIDSWGKDLSRLYIAYTRPDELESNFCMEDFLEFHAETIIPWQTWIVNLFFDIENEFGNVVPEAGSWDVYQRNYFVQLKRFIKEASNCLNLESFTIQGYAGILIEIIKNAYRLRQRYSSYKNRKELNAEYRTAKALELSTVHALSVIIWPLMPDYATQLYQCFNRENNNNLHLPSWESLPILLLPGEKITCFPPPITKKSV